MLPLCTHYSRSIRRMYDYYPGDKDNFAANTELAARFFASFELVPPGITSVAEWQAEGESQSRPTAVEACTYCAVARLS